VRNKGAEKKNLAVLSKKNWRLDSEIIDEGVTYFSVKNISKFRKE